jgi:hypothetical protein
MLATTNQLKSTGQKQGMCFFQEFYLITLSGGKNWGLLTAVSIQGKKPNVNVLLRFLITDTGK